MSISGSRGKGGPSRAERRRAVERGVAAEDASPRRRRARWLRTRSLPGTLGRAAACALALRVPELWDGSCSFACSAGVTPGAPPAQRDFSWKGGDPRRRATPAGPACPEAKKQLWLCTAARKLSKLRADPPPTWSESSGWPGA